MNIFRTVSNAALGVGVKPATFVLLSLILISSYARSESQQAELAELDDGNSFVLINARVFTGSSIIAPASVLSLIHI